MAANRTPEESIATSIVPYQRDDPKARYLSLRCCGFSIREALKLIGNAHSTLFFWRQNEVFVDLENRIPEFRKELGLEYANLEFMRNYRLVLEKDYRVLQKSLEKPKNGEEPEPLTTQEHQYLLKMRGHYTPQQLQAMEVISAAGGEEGFDFTKFVLTLTKTQQMVTLEAKRGESCLEGELVEEQQLPGGET